MNDSKETISLSNALGAREILRNFLTPTPFRQYPGLNRLVGAQVFIKHENHNPTGTFKIRGGINLMHQLKSRGGKRGDYLFNRESRHLCGNQRHNV